MNLSTTLKNAPTKELFRALNSNKAYVYFDISMFNVGARISIICTDEFKQDSARTWNGYNFTFENDNTTKYYILKNLEERVNDGTLVLNKRQKTIFNYFKKVLA